jgi:hypothetical protein
MKLDKKNARALARMAAMLSQVGVTVDVEKIQDDAKANPVTDSEKLEGVLASIRRPGDFTYRTCKRCIEPFGSNYVSVGYCSDVCRIKSFEELTGVKWSSNKSAEERWGGEPPLVIPPDVVRRMWEYSTSLMAYAESQGWASVEDIPVSTPVQSVVEFDPPKQDLILQPTENGRAISLEQPVQTIEIEFELPNYLYDAY